MKHTVEQSFEILILGLDPDIKPYLDTALICSAKGYRHRWLNESQLDQFQRLLRKGSRFEGDLIIISLRSIESALLSEWFGHDRCALTIEMLRLTHNEYRIGDLRGVLAIAELYCQTNRNCRILILTRAPDKDYSFTAPPYLRVAAWIHSDGTLLLDSGLFDLAINRKRFGFVGDRSSPREFDKQDPSASWGQAALVRRVEFERRLEQEFYPEGEQAFLRICNEVFKECNRLPAPKEYQVALGALRLCRRIVNWTLEGDAFNCTLLLCTQTQYEARTIRGRERIAPLFKFVPPIPFNFDNLSLIRNHAEMTQSDELLMFVNVTTGNLENISIRLPKAEELYRLKQLTSLSGRDAIVLHMRAGHFVEVYVQSELKLRFDGFQWNPDPLRDLERVIQAHTGMPTQAKGDDVQRRIDSLMDAIVALLDGYKSSIIVLLDGDDLPTLQKLVNRGLLTSMRDGVQTAHQSVAMWDFPAPCLTGILQIDGAHVIDKNGQLLFFGMKIGLDVRTAFIGPADWEKIESWWEELPIVMRDRIILDHQAQLVVAVEKVVLKHGQTQSLKKLNLSKDSYESLQNAIGQPRGKKGPGVGVQVAQSGPLGRPGTGTGEGAARQASLVLPCSYVVKVSASGSLKLFHRGVLV